MKSSFVISSIDELTSVAEQFLKQFPEPKTFVVIGEMGAGKTTLIKKICKALGADMASSPTFSLVNEYTTIKGVKIFHFDLYRVKSLEEALDFGFDEYLDQRAYIFIEWPDLVKPLLSENNEIYISLLNDVRSIVF